MEALNAARLTPVSVLFDRRTEPKKITSYSFNSPLKFPKSEVLSRNINGGVAFLSSVLGGGFAKALTYEEALQQSSGTSTSGDSFDFDFDVGGIIDTVFNFGAENPGIIIGGTAILGIPLVLSQVLKKPKPWGVESAKIAYEKLANDVNSYLLDIRAPVEFREMGAPDLRNLKKKPVSIVYKGEDKPGFLKKLSLKFKEPENTTIFILDKFEGNSELVAELLTVNGFKAAYAIRDGAGGTRGWMNSGLPWIPPKRTFSLDLSNFTDVIGGALGVDADALAVTLGLAAATGFSLLTFSEIETILQVLGSVALFQFVSQKFLFANDRNETLQQVDEFVTTKIVLKEFVDDIKEIGLAFLPLGPDKKSLPSSTVPDLNTDPKVEAIAEPIPAINSVPRPEVKAESLPGFPKSLSPFPYYPDFKPPTSPSPSQP